MLSRIRRAALAAALIAAPPALAQTVARPAGGSGTVTAAPSAPLVPESGTADYRLEIQGGCVVPQWTVAQGTDPFPTAGPCDQALPLNAVFYGGSRLRLEVDRTGKCFASPPESGIYSRNTSIPTCSGGLEQRYRAEVARTPGWIRLRSVTGQCLGMSSLWGAIGTPRPFMAEWECGDVPEQLFKLTRILPAGYVAPLNPSRTYPGTIAGARNPGGTGTAVATPVTPPEPPRPEGLAANAPLPGRYLIRARGPDSSQCIGIAGLRDDERGTANPRLRLGECRYSDFDLNYLAGRGFLIMVRNEPNACLTGPRLSESPVRPWISSAPCTAAADQVFAVEMTGVGDFAVIRTAAGLCLTRRGTLYPETSAQNNSAFFPEPCRDAVEQNFSVGRED